MSILDSLVRELSAGRIRVVDLTQTLSPEFPQISLPPEMGQAWPFRIEEVSRYDERGPAWYWNNFSCGEHTGTHFDAPIHWISGKDLPHNAVDSIPPERFIGPAFVIDCSKQAAADADFLLTSDFIGKWEKQHGRIAPRSWVLMRTDWSKKSTDPVAYQNYDETGQHTPGPDTDAVTEHPGIPQRRFHGRAAVHDRPGRLVVVADVGAPVLGGTAQHHVVAVRQEVRRFAEVTGVFAEEPVDARVLHDHQLTPYRYHLVVAGQLARAQAGAVDHHRCLPYGVGERGDRTEGQVSTRLRQPPGQVVQVRRHVGDRCDEPPPVREALRQLAWRAGRTVELGYPLRRFGAAHGLGAPGRFQTVEQLHAGVRIAREYPQGSQGLQAPLREVLMGRQKRPPDRSGRAGVGIPWQLPRPYRHPQPALRQQDRGGQPGHAGPDHEDFDGGH